MYRSQSNRPGKKGFTLSKQPVDLESLRVPALTDNPVMLAMLAEKPLWRVRTSTGDHAWLVLGFEEIRALLVDRRIGRTHPDPRNAPRVYDNSMLEMAATEVGDMDPREVHAEVRGLVAPYFSRKRMVTLRPRVQAVVDEAIDRMLSQGHPVDLRAEFAMPVPGLVLFELIGVPVDARTKLLELLDVMHRMDATEEDRMAALSFLAELAAEKRRNPGDDFLSALSDRVDDWNLASLAIMLIFAGHGSTSAAVVNGTLRLLTRPDLREELMSKPELMATAIEELLRTNNVGGLWLPHYAQEDIEIAGETIRGGDLVLPDFGVGNFDPSAFPDAERIDLRRNPNQHLTFAHGAWHCVGAPLVRMELDVIFTTLFTRIPTLRLDAELQEVLGVGADDDRFAVSVDSLPVAW